MFIDLPDGYTLDDLNGTKDEIPADPDVEPHSNATLVDPAAPANNLDGVTLEEIKGRGNFTWGLEKKPYQIKFDSSTAVLGMPAAKTWILLANHADPSLIRNKLAFDLAEAFGLPASPTSRFVDLTIEGEFLGNYLVTEKVEVKTNRLELQDPSGLLLELDNWYGLSEDFNFTTTESETIFVLKDAVADVGNPLPAPLDASYAQTQNYVNELETHLYARDPDWAQISAMIDVDSFIKYHFVQEVAANPEIVGSSVFFWRDGPDDVLHAGPAWDFDIAFANYSSERMGGDPRQDYVKNAQFLRERGNGWFRELFRNEEFQARAVELYATELRPVVETLVGQIDVLSSELAASAGANFARWDGVLGQRSVLDPRTVPSTWQGEITRVRDWVQTRVAHLAAAYASGIPTLHYSAHVASIGWQPNYTSGQIVGTVGQNLRMEALDISLLGNTLGGTVRTRAHVQNVGWMPWQDPGSTVGTTGEALRLEAVEFALTFPLAATYDVEYRVHVQNVGWMPWVRNGETAGTTGKSLRIEAIQIRLLEESPALAGTSVEYGAHVATVGWMESERDGAVAGTTGRALAMEALRVSVVSSEYAGHLVYRAHVQNIGWMPWTDSPEFIGTVGRSLRIEAIEISLSGQVSDHFSIRYSAHVQNEGWQDWAIDGQTAGTTGQAKRVEAVKIELIPKAS